MFNQRRLQRSLSTGEMLRFAMTVLVQTLVAAIALLVALPASAANLKALHRFTDTGNSTPSHYALGNTPDAELLQASDENFYGTTVYGGAGLCPNRSQGGYTGCGTIFRMTPQGASGAFPTAGLIQGADGFLYGVAQDGGLNGFGCNGALGCGTLFRISTSGAFKLLHQFCSGDGCPNTTEGGRPMGHLVQMPSGKLCDTTAEGGYENEGTVFCASTSGSVNTLYTFHFENGTDGYDPVAALVVGPDGETLYGTTPSRGANGGGTVFALKNQAMTNLYAFSSSGDCNTPQGALIFGVDGKLYGTTSAGYGCIFSVGTDGIGFDINYVFPGSSNAPADPVAGLVLGSDGMMYGTTLFRSIEQTSGLDSGVAYRFDPAKDTFKALADFNGTVGAMPYAALIEGKDQYLYGTASLYGGSNKRGNDGGSVVRLSPALKE